MGALAAQAAYAQDKVYQGGAWNDPGSWSPLGVPQTFDRVLLREPNAGNVALAGGVSCGAIVFDGNTTPFHLQGEAGSVARVFNISNFSSAANSISVGQLTGQPSFFIPDVLVLDGEALTVNANIVNDPASPTTPLNVYMRAVLNGTAANTGFTELIGPSELRGLGRIQSPTLRIEKSALLLNNTPISNPDRIADNTQVIMERGLLQITGSVNEAIGSMHIGAGNSLVLLSDDAAIRRIGSGILTRDNTHGRGVLEVAPETSQVSYFAMAPADTFADELVPYATVPGNGVNLPARYNPGPDLSPGSADDIGFEQVEVESFDPQLNTIDDDVIVDSSTSFAGNIAVRSLTVGPGASLNLNGGGSILINSGVICLSNAAPESLTQTVVGTLQIAPGREGFVHGVSGSYRIGCRISAGDGLTLGGGADFFLSAGNNISGQITMNGAGLFLQHPSAVTGNKIRLNEATLDIDYNTGIFTSPIVFDYGGESPTGSGSLIYGFTVNDNADINFSGTIQGRGNAALVGDNATFRFTSTDQPDANDLIGSFTFFVGAGKTVEVAGNLGDRSVGQNVTLIVDGGTVTGAGRLSGGTGLSAAARLKPGASDGNAIGVYKAGDISFNGGTIEIQVQGTNRGVTYDAIDLTDFLSSPGFGTVQLSGGLSGAIGTKLEIVRYPTFQVFGVLPNIINPLGLSQSGARWVAYFDEDSFDIAVAGPLGDATLDGIVNITDFAILASQFNRVGEWDDGDFDGNGVINISDFAILAANFNQALPGELPRAGAVPEPAAMGALLVLAGAMKRSRRC